MTEPTECQTENCDLPATHLDQFGHPICQECVDGAIFNGEPATGFIFIETVLACPYDQTTFCSCPECLLDTRCTNHECKLHPNMVELALVSFNENFTSQGLIEMKKEVALLPATATTDIEYDLVYIAHQRFKNIHLACRRKAESLLKTMRDNFKTAKEKNKDELVTLKSEYATETARIKTGLEFVLEKIDPINRQLADAREDWDNEQARKKTERATEEAAKQEAERDRLEIARGYDQAWLDNAKHDDDKKEAQDLIDERAQLELEKRKFAREKDGLTVDEAWTDAHHSEDIKTTLEEIHSDPNYIDLPGISTAPDPSDPDIETLREFAKPDTSPPVETFAATSAAGLESLKNDDSIIENAVAATQVMGRTIEIKETDTVEDIGTKIDEVINDERIENIDISVDDPGRTSGPTHQTENFSDGPASIIYSTDPAEKEKQLLEQDRDHTKNVIDFITVTISTLEGNQAQGFESRLATTATRRLIEDIQTAADRFSAAVTPREQEQPESDIKPDDCPF